MADVHGSVDHGAEPRRTVASDRLVLGALVGALWGALAGSFGIPGLTSFPVVAVFVALIPPRFAALAGFFLAAGGVWLAFTTQGAFFCAANPASCSGPSLVPFAVGSAIIFAMGAWLWNVTRNR